MMAAARKLVVPGLVLAVVGAAGLPVAAAAAPTSAAVLRYVVQTSSATAATSAAAAVTAAGGVVTNRYSRVFTGFSATTTAAEAQTVRGLPGVVTVAADGVTHTATTHTATTHTATTQTNPPWGLDRIDQIFRPLDHSYTYDTTGSGVTAFVVDSGVRLSHATFAGRATSGYDFVDHDSVATDCSGHGTKVASVIGGYTFGVAKKTKLVSLRAFDCAGNGYFSTMIAAVDWAIAHRPAGNSLINISGGGAGYPLMDLAVRQADAAGIPVVVSAGNDNGNACSHSPAREPSALTIASSDSADKRAATSNYGSCVDLFAPGVHVRAASNTSDTSNGYYDGTSLAAAHVSGIVARLLQTPGMQGGFIAQVMTSGAVPGLVQDVKGSPNLLAFATNPDILPPTMPQNVRATTNNSLSQATLTWSIPASNGGSPITAYRVSRDGTDSKGVGAWSALVPATARSQTFINLKHGVVYNLSVEAITAYYIGDLASVPVQLS